MTGFLLAVLGAMVLLLLIAVICVAALVHLGRRIDRLESTPLMLFGPADTAQGVGAPSQSPSLSLTDPLAAEASGTDGRPPTSVPPIPGEADDICRGCGSNLAYDSDGNRPCLEPSCVYYDDGERDL